MRETRGKMRAIVRIRECVGDLLGLYWHTAHPQWTGIMKDPEHESFDRLFLLTSEMDLGFPKLKFFIVPFQSSRAFLYISPTMDSQSTLSSVIVCIFFVLICQSGEYKVHAHKNNNRKNICGIGGVSYFHRALFFNDTYFLVFILDKMPRYF